MESDVGSSSNALLTAMEEVGKIGGVIRSRSRLYRTPAIPLGSGPDYVNAVFSVEASWSPLEALTHFHNIEARMGRRRTVRWGQRVIDIDLLAVNDMVRPDAATLRVWMDLVPDQQREKAPGQLLLPHPRLHQRAFVLVPLAEVAPDWVHPIIRRSVTEMLSALPKADLDAVVALD
jgi:2-amino-4-hydroxy-6-hydroxymethyldihydropteridine diphosphokinase